MIFLNAGAAEIYAGLVHWLMILLLVQPPAARMAAASSAAAKEEETRMGLSRRFVKAAEPEI
jgi:hypothetical protein